MSAQELRRSPSFNNGEAGITFDNTGNRPLLVPGSGLPVPIELPANERFAHGFLDWAQNRLTAREIAMLRLMNSITDRLQWHFEIRDPVIVAEWAKSALSQDLISQAAWEWCLAELRDKAMLYWKSKITLVLDSASRICKSDHLITPTLLNELAAEVERLPGWVDPDMYPLVYGQTRVLKDCGHVGCIDAVECAGRGTTSRAQIWRCPNPGPDFRRCDGSERVIRVRGGHPMRGRGRGGISACDRCGRPDHGRIDPPEQSWEPRGDRFSPLYQWLPSEIGFGAGEVQGGRKIAISSYINNLHPRKNSAAYKIVEKFIEASILPWNETLVFRDRGRTPERIRTYGVQWSPDPPHQSDLDDLENIMKNPQSERYQYAEQRLRSFLEQPENSLAPVRGRWPLIALNSGSWKQFPSSALRSKYTRVKRWLHPEPGVSFTYQEWKEGRNNRAVVPARTYELELDMKNGWMLPPSETQDDPNPKENHQFYSVDLERDFAEQGLQVIIEIGGFDLTPEKPTQDATDWQLSGLPNDHIVATTVIYFSSENVTPGSISFRVEADLDPAECVWGTDTGSNPHHPLAPLADIFGCESSEDLGGDYDPEYTPGGPAIQVLGSVNTPDGRLLTFPNVMQHRIEGVSLLDPSRPGRRRFLKLHLVDPHYRICSTRNVPPQRYDWWHEAGPGRIDWERYAELPTELWLQISELVGNGGFSSAEDAERVRRELWRERQGKYELVNRNVELYRFVEADAIGGKTHYKY